MSYRILLMLFIHFRTPTLVHQKPKNDNPPPIQIEPDTVIAVPVLDNPTQSDPDRESAKFHNQHTVLSLKMSGLFLLISVLCIGVSGTVASVCCFPKQYEANQGIAKATVQNGQLSVMTGNLHYWFDGVSRRETFHEDIDIDGIHYNIVVIKDYNITNTKYVITGNHCTQKSLTPFKEGCIPDWAQQLTTSSYGRQDSGRSFTVYNNTAGSVTSFLIATDDCFPMLDVSILPHGSSPYMQVVMPYNFTVGIKDQSVFDIPAICGPPTNVG